MLERVYGASALTVAVQDGKAAGQTVGHVHAHVIPRREGDMEGRGGNDAVYEMLERREDGWADVGRGDGLGGRDGKGGGRAGFKPDAERRPRSVEEMNREAEWLRGEMERELELELEREREREREREG